MDKLKLSSKKIIVMLLLMSVTTSSLVGCSKKDEEELTREDYIALYDNANSQLEKATDTIDSLKMELNAYGETMTESDITQPYELLEDGTTKVYNTFNDYVIIKNKIDWGATEQIGNTSKISLDGIFAITPSDTWSVKLNSSKTTLSNDSNIAGSLQLWDFYNTMDAPFLYSEYIKGYLEDIGVQKIVNKNIYIAGSACGVLTRSILKVNKKVKTEEKLEVREDFIKSGDKVLLDELERQEKEAEKARKQAEKEAKKVAKNGENVEVTPSSSVQSLDDTIGEVSSLDDTISTDISARTSPSPSLEPSEPTPIPEYKNVTVTTTEKKEVEYVYYIGAINSDNRLLEFKFIFENDENAKMKEELVVQFLKSLSINEVNVTLE